MAFMYCQSCGGKLEYTLKKPNFCMHCGTALGSVEAAEPVATDPDPPVKKISKLEYEISSSQINAMTVGDIVKQDPQGFGGRLPHKSKTGDAVKDSINLCRPSKSMDVDGIRGEE